MVNVYNTLKYSDEITIDNWNEVIKEIFFHFFDSEEVFLKNKELLRTELLNYIKYIANKDDKELLFKNIHEEFKKAILINEVNSIKELATSLIKVSETDNLYMNYYISQPKDISNFTPRDLAFYYFDVIYNILEGCFKPRIELFYRFYHFNLKGEFPNIENKTFGDIVNLITGNDEILKDPYLDISISQWRNISTHKDYKITKNEIIVEYGKKNKKNLTLSHQQLRNIAFWVNTVYGVLRLAEVLIYLNYVDKIMATEEAKNMKFGIRSESMLLSIIHNLQTVGFQFESFNEIENIFELNLYIKQNNDIRESVIHASQIFTQIAIALDEDDFQKERFEFIKINILDKNKVILAYAVVDIQICLDFSFGKITMTSLIEKINFNIANNERICY